MYFSKSFAIRVICIFKLCFSIPQVKTGSGSRLTYSGRRAGGAGAGPVWRHVQWFTWSWRLASRWTFRLDESTRCTILLLAQHVFQLLLFPCYLLPLLSTAPAVSTPDLLTQLTSTALDISLKWFIIRRAPGRCAADYVVLSACVCVCVSVSVCLCKRFLRLNGFWWNILERWSVAQGGSDYILVANPILSRILDHFPKISRILYR